MSLQHQLGSDLNNSLKNKKSFEVGTLRLLLSALHNRSIEKRGKGLAEELTDEEVLEVLNKEAKKRKEAFEIYFKAGRRDLAKKEADELEFIKRYLPAPATAGEIEKAVAEAVEKTGVKEAKDFGKVMGEAMKSLKNKADAGIVSEAIKKILR